MVLNKIVLLSTVFCFVNGFQYLNRPEGSSCQWLNATGVCVDARLCISFEIDVKKKMEPPICAYNGKEPIICCTDCSVLEEKYKIKDQLDRPRYQTDRKYKKKCFEYEYLLPYKCKTHATYDSDREWNETRKCYKVFLTANAPVGSEDALRGDFPHMALLGYGPNVETAQWLCGGSLISERFILTAGHCASSTQLGDVKYVALGMLKRTDPPEYWKKYKVKRFIPHPDYHPPVKYNDIALIETETPVNLTEGVYPGCLTHKPEFWGDNVAFATGWGSLGPGKENADVLQKVVLQKFSQEDCSSQYPVHRHTLQGVNHTTQICYGDHNQTRDTCQGDSGGPLQQRDPDGRYCVYAIIGVTSTGLPCGKPGGAGIYTRVYHYLPWIESIVWP